MIFFMNVIDGARAYPNKEYIQRTLYLDSLTCYAGILIFKTGCPLNCAAVLLDIPPFERII